MAVIYELVVNFGDDHDAAQAAVRTLDPPPVLPAGPHAIRFFEPTLDRWEGYHGNEFWLCSLVARNVGYGLANEDSAQRIPMKAAELTQLTTGLYGVLSELRGYRAACVGFDPESVIDLAELREEFLEELAGEGLPGLVLSEAMGRELGAGPAFVPYREGFSWCPYEGSGEGTLDAEE
ncbi:hypothetical protein ABT160_13980 [Streptomyces sp. NPDC001941]|uniref:hypothetical protein n=1 Tax=Streptomyces sp. NPDC001941 TaxID=3154659 RepID=UPI0033285A5B